MNTPHAAPLNPSFRSHMCGEVRASHAGQTITLAGWIFRRRDHGGVVFIDLRDTTGVVQVVLKPDTLGAEAIEKITHTGQESVLQVEGTLVLRGAGLVNPNLPTGEVELDVASFSVLSAAEPLPYSLHDADVPEDLRLTYRFLDLRREDVAGMIRLRNSVVQHLRQTMWGLGFQEFQTPILTASSPEGARDFLVPSRLHPGKFYALPQAPQQFKQLLMISGFDKYFQIAPCFRDEDARADRCPTDFYQLDLEMSFVEQADVFKVAEAAVGSTFEKFADWNTSGRNTFGPRKVEDWRSGWRHIKYDDAMLKYASDKPDLRCPLEIVDVSDTWAASTFEIFQKIISSAGVVRGIAVPGTGKQPRSWFDNIGKWAQTELGASAAPGYIRVKSKTHNEHADFDSRGHSWHIEYDGPLTKFLNQDQLTIIFLKALGKSFSGELEVGDTVFFVAGKTPEIYKILNPLRVRLGADCGLNQTGIFKFCWVVDFPFYEAGEGGKPEFAHNPFSMPQGGLKALEDQDPLTIKAQQYDLVCNGYELISGGIRNHEPATMLKAFEIAGLSADVVKDKFRGMWKALHLGAPPHGGCAAGLERMVMLLAESTMVREVVAFPMTQKGEDLLMGAPTEATERQLKELHIKLR
jgi:aspartyl-tRNA synthetase